MGAFGIVIGILILSIMMLLHELGHYIAGRKLGFKVEEFSIFMGPVLYEWQKNGIRYNVKLLPIGASVRFAGDEEPAEKDEKSLPVYDSDDPGLFYNRPKWARAVVIGTGPAINLLSGILAFLIMFSAFGFTIPVIQATAQETQAFSSGLEAGDRVIRANGERIRTTLDYTGAEMFVSQDQVMELEVRKPDGSLEKVRLEPVLQDRYRLGITIFAETGNEGARIESVDPQSNQGNPVLKPGDILISANGVPYSDAAAFRNAVQEAAKQPIRLSVIRDGKTLELEMKASHYSEYMPRGVYFTVSNNFFQAIGQSFQWSASIVKVTIRSIGMMFSGALKPQETLSGPVGVVSLIGDVVNQKQPISETIYQLLWLFAIISVSLGFMNLLPIPPLDGHHLVLIGVEAIRGRRLSVKVQSMIGYIGFALIIGLALMGLVFDIMRLSGR
jgi:regulator of sigma E protease